MPAAFNEERRNEIRTFLIEAAKEDFAAFGYKKMSLRDLTARVGIALGTFYSFFESKEDLLYHVIIAENAALHSEIEQIFADSDDPETALKNFAEKMLRVLDNNKILEQFLLRNELGLIFGKLTREHLENQRNESLKTIVSAVQGWQDAGLVKDIDPVLIGNAFRSLFFLNFHKKQFGEEDFDRTIHFIFDAFIQSILTTGSEA